MITNVTLKLPARLKVRIARAAKHQGKSTGRWMLEAIEREVDRRERFLAYVNQAHRDLTVGSTEEADARSRVRQWLKELPAGDKTSRRAVRRIR